MTDSNAPAWYYARNDQQQGPVSAEGLRGLIARGEVRGDTLVWRDGMPEWAMAANVPEFAGSFAAVPQPQSGGYPAQAAYGAPVMGYYGQPVSLAGTEYVGFWWRVLATIIDSVVTGIAGAILGGIMGGILGAAMGNTPQMIQVVGLLGQVLGLLINWLYSAIMESSAQQATLGKMAIGVRVVDANGGRLTFARATGRFFAKMLSALILGIGYIMVAFTERKQGLHDLIAGTFVVRGRPGVEVRGFPVER